MVLQSSGNADDLKVAELTDQPRILVGIDWADSEHAFTAVMPSGSRKVGSFKQNKTAIDEWIKQLRHDAPKATIDICIETSNGGLVNGLLEYDDVRIFPVNPLALANYRKQLRQLKTNLPQTRELDALV